MEEVFLKNKTLKDCKNSLVSKIYSLKWRGFVLTEIKEEIYGCIALGSFLGEAVFLVEPLAGFDPAVFSKKHPVLVEETEVLEFENKGFTVKTLPSLFFEYRLVCETIGSKKNGFGQTVKDFLDSALFLLTKMDAQEETKKAYCISCFLKKEDLLSSFVMYDLQKINPLSLVLAMEFRKLYLSFKISDPLVKGVELELSSLVEVNKMIAADKVVGYKGFKNSGKNNFRQKDHYLIWLNKLAPYFDFKFNLESFLNDRF